MKDIITGDVLAENPKARIVRPFVEFLKEESIPYALLGVKLDLSASSSDVDFVIPHDSFVELDKILGEFATAKGFTILQRLNHESTASFYVLSYWDEDENKHLFYHLDFCSDYKRSGRLLIPCATLLENRIYNYETGYWTLTDAYSFLYYFLKKVDKGSLRSDHFESLLEVWRRMDLVAAQTLIDYFGEDGSKLIAQIFDNEDFHRLSEELQPLRILLHRKCTVSLKDRLREMRRKLWRMLEPAGLTIGVLGRDGSGKTTFIDSLLQNIHPCFRVTKTYHLYPGVILKHKAPTTETQRPHEVKKRSLVLSLMKLNLLLVEYVLGDCIKVFPGKVRANGIIFDRYFADIIADPVRYRQREHKMITQLYNRLIPQPDLWFVLDVSSEVLLTRKQEISFDTAEDLRRKYLRLGNSLRNATIINTEEPLSSCRNRATSIIIDFLAERRRRRA